MTGTFAFLANFMWSKPGGASLKFAYSFVKERSDLLRSYVTFSLWSHDIFAVTFPP